MNEYGDNDFKCGLEADIVNMTLVLFNGQQSVTLQQTQNFDKFTASTGINFKTVG